MFLSAPSCTGWGTWVGPARHTAAALPSKAGLTSADGGGAPAYGKRGGLSASYPTPTRLLRSQLLPSSSGRLAGILQSDLSPGSATAAVSRKLSSSPSALLPPSPLSPFLFFAFFVTLPGSREVSWASKSGPGQKATLPTQPGNPEPFVIHL